MKAFFFVLTAATILISCKENKGSVTGGISEDSIRRHISILASDEFQGRKPFSAGETKTLEYLENEARKMGLQPGNGSSYFQDVPLIEIAGHPSEELVLDGPDSLHFRRGEEFVAWTQRPVDSIDIRNSELVFCGYGIVAPEYNWNDYEGIDMNGKIALVLVNDPGLGSEDSTFFKGNTMTYYGRWTYKFEEAARQGARGILIIHEATMAGYPWAVVRNSGSGSKLNLESLAYTPCEIQGWVSLESGKEIFSNAGLDLQKTLQDARKPLFKAIPLPYKVNAGIKNDLRRDVSKNVIALLPGTEKPDEYIVFSAHWDHLGIGPKVEGDSIYNGAADNASGCAALLAIAESLVRSDSNKRSIVFLWVTAEEQGLLGSEYYAANPIFPPEQTVANINMDGLSTYGKMKDLSIIGFGQSEMESYTQRWAEKQGRYIVPDPEPEKGYFFRSDHFNFAKIGIPALYAKGVADHMEKGKEYAADQERLYRSTRYHQPSDELTETFNVSGIAQDAELYMQVAKELANSDDWPRWKEGSEFKSLRKRN